MTTLYRCESGDGTALKIEPHSRHTVLVRMLDSYAGKDGSTLGYTILTLHQAREMARELEALADITEVGDSDD